MLTDILGIALAFASVMLLFSMVVTTTVQAIQVTFDLRYQNLRRGLLKIADNVDEISQQALEKGLNKLLYFSSSQDHNLVKKWFGVRKTEVTAAELMTLLQQELDNVNDEILHKVITAFSDLEQYMSKLYQRIMHFLALVISLLLAFSCQLNTFELLKQLSADPQLRESYIQMLQDTTGKSSNLKPLMSYSEIKHSALEALMEKHPGIKKIDTNNLSADEIKALLKKKPGSLEIAEEFDDLLYKKIETREKLTREALNDMESIGSRYNFTIKAEFQKYYWDNKLWLSNVLGTLMSGVLISLGAPFWFNAIRNITSMRDRTAKRVVT